MEYISIQNPLSGALSDTSTTLAKKGTVVVMHHVISKNLVWQLFVLDWRVKEFQHKLPTSSWHPLSRRPGTERAYRSAWQQWTSWCSQREIAPLCPSLGKVLDFLTKLFYRGRQNRTLSGYRSALSMTLSPINGVLVGQHPLVSRLLKGAYHSWPPQPRYRFTWDVEWSCGICGPSTHPP